MIPLFNSNGAASHDFHLVITVSASRLAIYPDRLRCQQSSSVKERRLTGRTPQPKSSSDIARVAQPMLCRRRQNNLTYKAMSICCPANVIRLQLHLFFNGHNHYSVCSRSSAARHFVSQRLGMTSGGPHQCTRSGTSTPRALRLALR